MFADYAQMTAIDDRMPERSGMYYCRTVDGDCKTLYFHRRRQHSYWTDGYGYRVEVAAWRECEES